MRRRVSVDQRFKTKLVSPARSADLLAQRWQKSEGQNETKTRKNWILHQRVPCTCAKHVEYGGHLQCNAEKPRKPSERGPFCMSPKAGLCCQMYVWLRLMVV